MSIKLCLRCSKEFSQKKNQSEWHWRQQKWCSPSCRSNGLRKGRPFKERNVNWKGGRSITTQGYVAIYQPEHPSTKSRSYVLEHRLVMEKYLGRYLEPSEVVHHINHDKKRQ